MPLFGNEREPRRIEDHRPIRWKTVKGQYAPLSAGADLTSTPYGNVERNVGYVIMLSFNDLETMDFDLRLYAQTILDMIEKNEYYAERLRVNYTEEMLWPHGNKPFIASGDFSAILKGSQ